MKRPRIIVLLWLAGLFLGTLSPVRAGVQPLLTLTAADRVLVLAPHEDDETLGVGGLLQQVVSVHAAVRIVFATYGDHDGWGYFWVRKKPWIGSKVNRQLGEIRRTEALQAAGVLGISPDQLVFLGYPDGGLLKIWEKHWFHDPPYYSSVIGSNRVVYADAYSYRKMFTGDNILADLEQQLRDFRPTRIFVTHPLDAHGDHQACFYFLEAALAGTSGEFPSPDVYCYPIHFKHWPRPKGYRPALSGSIPPSLAGDSSTWFEQDLSPDQVKQQSQAIRLYKTQKVVLSWMLAFARRSEFFTPAPPPSGQGRVNRIGLLRPQQASH
jgi:LmbE family N-acetylglucosaminyl deacetylase